MIEWEGKKTEKCLKKEKELERMVFAKNEKQSTKRMAYKRNEKKERNWEKDSILEILKDR